MHLLIKLLLHQLDWCGQAGQQCGSGQAGEHDHA